MKHLFEGILEYPRVEDLQPLGPCDNRHPDDKGPAEVVEERPVSIFESIRLGHLIWNA